MPRFRMPPALSERNHALITVALGFLAGCRLAVLLEAGPWLWALFLLSLLLGLVLRRLGMRAGVALALCALSLGALRAQACLSPVQPVPGRYQVTGSVHGEARLRDDGRLTFALGDIALDGVAREGLAYCTLYLNGEDPPMLFDGAALRFDGRVYLPEGKSGAPHFDFRLWMLQKGMRFGIAVSRGLEVENTPQTAPIKDGASHVRAAFRRSLERTMGENARLAMALLVNDRYDLAEDEQHAFQTLGIAHVLSVSGLHVGLLGYLFMLMLRAFRFRRAFQLPVLALFLAGYCALTGFSAACVRASVMLLAYLLARLLGRRADPLATLGAALLVVLAFSPLQAFSAGFVLSFSAVACISLLCPVLLDLSRRIWPPREALATAGLAPWRRALRSLGRYLGGPRSLLCLSLAAQLGVLLPTAVYFHRLPLYGVLINLPLIPYVSLLIPAYVLALLLSPVPLMGSWAGALASLMSDGLLSAVRLLSTLPYASVRVPSAPMAVTLGAALCLLIASRRLRARPGKRLIAAALICALAAGGAWLTRPEPLRYIQLDVGRADAALIFDSGATIAIDVGDDGMAAADYLLSEGRDLDALYLTHLHLDHAGGVHALLDSGIEIRRVYLPVNASAQRLSHESLAVLDRLKEEGVPVTELAAGDELRYNEVAVRALWPVRENARTGQEANEQPLVLAVDFDGWVIAGMSDLPSAYEGYAAVPCDVLKVAHHGSPSSTGNAFLAFAQPRAALVGCSSGSASLPGADTLARLQSHGVELYRTDLSGDITLTIRDGRLCLTPYKARLKD